MDSEYGHSLMAAAYETLRERMRELDYGDEFTDDEVSDYASELVSNTPHDDEDDLLQQAETDADLEAALIVTGRLEP